MSPERYASASGLFGLGVGSDCGLTEFEFSMGCGGEASVVRDMPGRLQEQVVNAATTATDQNRRVPRRIISFWRFSSAELLDAKQPIRPRPESGVLLRDRLRRKRPACRRHLRAAIVVAQGRELRYVC
jgi:hypothetical protein